jgi:hypothetical protein
VALERGGAIDNLLRILQAHCPDAATRTLVAERVNRLRQGLDREGERLLAEAMAASGITSLEEYIAATESDDLQARLEQAAAGDAGDPCQARWVPLPLAMPPALNTIANILEPPVNVVVAVLEFVKGVLQVISAFLLAIPDPIRALIMAAYQLLREIVDNFLNTGAYLYVDAPGVTSTLATLEDLGLDPPEPPKWLAGDPILGAEGTVDAFDSWAQRFERSFDDPGDSKRPVFSEGSTLEAAFIVGTAPDISALSPLLELIDNLIDFKPFRDAVKRFKDRLDADDPDRSELRGSHGVAPDWQAWRIRDLAPNEDHPLSWLDRLPELLLGLLKFGENIVELIQDLVAAIADKVDVLLELAKMLQAIIDMLRALSASGLYVLPVVTDEGVPGLKRRFLEAADRPGTEFDKSNYADPEDAPTEAQQPSAMVGVCFLGGMGEFGTATLAGLWALLGIDGEMGKCFSYIDDPGAYLDDRKRELREVAEKSWEDTKALANDAWEGAEVGNDAEQAGLKGLLGHLEEDVRGEQAAKQQAMLEGLGMGFEEADAQARSARNQLVGGIEQMLQEGQPVDPMLQAHVEATRRARRRGRRSLAMAFGDSATRDGKT